MKPVASSIIIIKDTSSYKYSQSTQSYDHILKVMASAVVEQNNVSTQQLVEQSIKDDGKHKETVPVGIDQESTTTPKDTHFWLIILGLLIATFLSALNFTGLCLFFLSGISSINSNPLFVPAISTVLPTIMHTLKSEYFTWIGNTYSIASTVFIP